jgi:deazaflavin-dependent oxidoreductase (nitroreductase family)
MTQRVTVSGRMANLASKRLPGLVNWFPRRQAGTPQAPNWWKNLVTAGSATAQVGEDTYEVDVRVVTDDAERATAWAELTAAYPDFASYQALTDRVLPIGVLTRRAS